MTREYRVSRFSSLPQRCGHLVIVLFGITLVTFFLLRLLPGNPAVAILGTSYTPARAAAIDSTLGLNRPIWSQYGLFLGHLFQGNLGFSFFYGQPATTVIVQHIAPTVFLVIYSAVLAALISFPIGFAAGLRRGGVIDQSSRILFTVSFAMPGFWLGIILLLVFSVHLHAFPISGFGGGFAQHLYYLFLPALTIALGFSTVLVRSLRAATIATLQAEFVDTARMKGIRWRRVLRRHVFRNSILAVVAVFGVNLAYLISGTVLVENVFSLPGLGSLLVNSVADRDYPVVQGVTLLFAVLIVAINLLADIVQAALDPRVGQEAGT
jgi:peptide/nickel transport system permease protein